MDEIVFSIGRNQCDLILTHDSVSKKHGEIRINSGKVFYRDIGSSNGTFVQRNGLQYKLEAMNLIEIYHGDIILFGDYQMTASELFGRIKEKIDLLSLKQNKKSENLEYDRCIYCGAVKVKNTECGGCNK